MPRRTRLGEGIYADRYGLAATVKVGNVQREQRFPAGTETAILQSWRIQKRAELDADRTQQPKAVRGSVQAEGDTWITRKAGLVSFAADRSHLKAWYPAIGHLLRSNVTPAHVEMQMATWRTAGVAARTIRHRVRVLRELYHGLDGPKARTPVDDVKLGAPPRPEPRAVPLKAIRAVAQDLKDSDDPRLRKHYARYLVRVTTGQRPSLIMRALPGDVDMKRRIWFVRSGKGGHPVPLPLNADMVRAWTLFAKADAWGAFDTSNAARVLRRHGWPKNARPYDLRHTFAIDMLLQGADLENVQGLLGHSQIQTTQTHYAPIQTALLRRTVAKRRLNLP